MSTSTTIEFVFDPDEWGPIAGPQIIAWFEITASVTVATPGVLRSSPDLSSPDLGGCVEDLAWQCLGIAGAYDADGEPLAIPPLTPGLKATLEAHFRAELEKPRSRVRDRVDELLLAACDRSFRESRWY